LNPSPSLLIDALKAVAAQLIVVHHLAAYGPMSAAIEPQAPWLIDGLFEYGRLAVQVFLVIGGFLAARSLAPEGVSRIIRPVSTIWRRYLRLAIPYFAAIGLALLVNWTVRTLLPHEGMDGAPTLPQLAANLTMLQSILGVESVSAGLWYVAMDLQLFVLMVLLIHLSTRPGLAISAVWLVGALAAASLFWFNRDASLDAFAPYFFGAYGLGALAWWSGRSPYPWRYALPIAVVGLIALTLEFRLRILVALITAAVLMLGVRNPPWRMPARLRELIHWLGARAYSVFLVHYPVCMLINAGVLRTFGAAPVPNWIGLVMAWACSILTSALFFRFIEQRGMLSRPNNPDLSPG
jgi:peptidoglycan/LPS O-acetylase OafA/YrhL